MSPEHINLHDLHKYDANLEDLVRSELKRLSWNVEVVAQSGFAFVVSGGVEKNVKLEHLSDLNENQRADAKKSTSNRHVILPIQGRSNHNKHAVHHNRLNEHISSIRSSR